LEQELDLFELWQVIAKRSLLIIFLPLLAAAASAAISIFVLVPQYQASTTLLVMKPTETTQILYQDIQVSRQLVDTYREIARSDTVLNKVVANLRLNYNTDTVRNQVDVTSVRNTEIINISATNPNPEVARDIANEVARVFMSEVVDLYKVENVSLIDRAVIPAVPVSPRVQLNVAVAYAVGLMAALGLAFLQEYLDKTIKTPEDVQKHLQLPVLGIIPYVNKK
jgi:capsular polysaccharide biosynthesis protein